MSAFQVTFGPRAKPRNTGAWLQQQMQGMSLGINAGKTRRRKVASVRHHTTEADVAREVKARGWRVAQIGDDYVFAPGTYTIRPIV